jgi:hypothetical protein
MVTIEFAIASTSPSTFVFMLLKVSDNEKVSVNERNEVRTFPSDSLMLITLSVKVRPMVFARLSDWVMVSDNGFVSKRLK